MRAACIAAVSLTTVLASGLGIAQEDPRKKAELKWAKELVTDFFTAASAGQISMARELLTKGMRDEMPNPTEVRTEIWSPLLDSGAVAYSTEEILFDQDEAVFRGTFKQKDKEYSFVVRVVKGTEQRVWRICFLQTAEKKKSK